MPAENVTQLGHYKILSTLGKGGMATVYRAEDARTHEIVAIKMMANAYTERKDMALRFRREFRAIRRLAHPNIVRVLDAGEAAGSFYFAMEYVDGVDLVKYFGLRAAGKAIRPEILHAPGRVRKVLEVAAQIAEALLFIHGERIVHRDMKPTNVLVTRDGTVKLMDFGIAKELDQTAALTRHGSFLGTAYYTAPEQIKASRDLDGRADLYGLGVMLYEALAGKLPFFSENTVEVLRMHILEPPKPLTELNPSIPAEVDAVIGKLLAKDPQDRYRDAGELLEAIRALADYPKDQDTREWSAPDIARRPVVASGLIGRDRELSRLVDAMDAASVGQPVLVSVTGPLGVGKTRLLRGLEEHVRASSAIFLAGRYHSDRPGPYIAWREALNASVTYLMGFGIPFARRIAGPFGKVLRSVAPAFDELEKGAPPLARLSPEEDRLRLFEAVLGYLRALSKNAPVVILLDNFQWAFEADYELASFLLRGFVGGSGKDSRAVQATPCSVMLAVAYRDDETPPDHPLRRVALGRPEPIRFLELRLQPFSQDEVRELLVAMGGGVAAFGSKEELDRLVGNVMLETGGNPYHVEEMAKAIITSPVPVNPAASAAAAPVAPAPAAADGKAAVAAIVSEVNATIAAGENPLRAVSEDGITIRAADNQTRQVVPSSSETTKRNLGDLVLLRVKVLSPEAQGVLRAASIIAEGIEFELLARLSDVDEDSLLDVIDELIRQRFLVERDRGDLFDFYQTVVREAVYGAVEDPERIRLHGKMAELLKERAHANPESYAALLALHAERAGDRVLASQSYLAAGDAALRGNRVDEAERYFDRARELGALVPTHADHTTTAEIEIDLRRGSLLLARGEPAEAAKVFEGIMAEAKERGDKPRAGAIAHRLGVAYALSGNHVLAIANLEWALEVSREIGDRQLEADALDGLGSAQQVRGNFDKALEYMREALALRKSLKDRVGATRALYGAGRALAAKGDLRHALKIHRDALKFSTHLSETAGAARGHGELGELYRLMGSPKRAAEHLDQALALGRKAGARDVEIAVLTSQALLALASGDLGNARRLVNDAIQMGRSVGDLKLLSMALLAAADEAMLRNDLVAAKGKYEEARALAGKLGDRPARAASARGLSQVARRAKALDSARAYLVEARKTHEKIGARLGELEDIVDEAGVALAEAIAHTGSSGGPRSRGGVNQMEVARDAIQKVLPEIAALHAIPLRARALLMLGELHLGLRQAGEAIAAAQEAYTLAESALSRDDALRARLVGARAYLLQKDVRRAGPMYRQALDILKAVAGQIADKTERLAYLAEPDRRSLVDEIKALAAKPAP